ncbi:hypothetical protein QUF72_10900 [Desulfobacterales bacterium HSG2]|nr:hypothetical protein [Desulfobacterales bacterium HSG2]
MQNYLVKSWTEAVKASMVPYKDVTETVAVAMSKMRETLLNERDVAELGKFSLDSAKEFRTNCKSAMNKQIRHQLGTMNLNVWADSIEEFGKISTSAVKRLAEWQMETDFQVDVVIKGGA